MACLIWTFSNLSRFLLNGPKKYEEEPVETPPQQPSNFKPKVQLLLGYYPNGVRVVRVTGAVRIVNAVS